MMQAYRPEIERAMKEYDAALSEKDQRRYAAVEALELGQGGQMYAARILGCSEKTVLSVRSFKNEILEMR